jgi:nucleoid-associated protein YgaU
LQSPDFPAAEVTPEQPRPVTTGPRRKHRIVDGDSLRLIALRYFGDASRATEIAEINRDVIADPGLLPVGVEIVIPADAAEIER